MTRRSLLVAAVLVCFASQAQLSADLENPFRARYPTVQPLGFEPSPIEGRVQARTQLTRFFHAPASQPSSMPPLRAAPAAAESSGVRVKDGAIVMTAYLDVHCGYCAQAVDWIVNQGGLPHTGLDVVFVSRSAQDLELAEHVLCAPKHLRGTALHQVFSTGPVIDRLRCEKGHAEARIHDAIAARNGVFATPVFAVKDQIVLGFDRERLESLVIQTGKQPKG